MVGAGAVALGAGLGIAWWRQSRLSEAEQALWNMSAEGLTDEPLRLAAFQGQRVLVNFWATWCAPCVEELPMLSQFQADHGPQGWQVVGLAIDQRSAVSRFIQRVPVQFPVGMTGPSGLSLMRQLGNDRGGLPFTVVLNRQGVVAQRKIGQLSSSDLKVWLQELA
jgi:thiol-disulfide isomerase/thioredoxin